MIVIIGAGISGLYLGYLLYKHEIPFIILEASNRAGGNIYTEFTDDGHPIEKGASIFHSHQKNIMKLVRDFAIPIHKIDQTVRKTYIKPVPSEVLPFPAYSSPKKRVCDVWTQAQKLHYADYDETSLMNYNDWKRGYDNVGEIYACKKGLIFLVNKLFELLKDYIVLNCPVTSINTKTHMINETLPYTMTVICTSANTAKKIRIIPIIKRWNTIKKSSITMPTVRIYAQFKKHAPYSSQIISKQLFRWYIPISNTLCMLSYVDGRRALKLIKMKKKEALSTILEELEINPSSVKKIWFAPWLNAYNVLKANLSSDFKRDMHKVNEVIYQTFLPDPLNQAWMEGHLIQAYKIFKEIQKGFACDI